MGTVNKANITSLVVFAAGVLAIVVGVTIVAGFGIALIVFGLLAIALSMVWPPQETED